MTRNSFKVVHLTSGHGVEDARVFQKECRSLVRAGYDTVLVLPHTRNDHIAGVRVRAVSRTRGRLRRISITTWRLYRAALRENADVYHFHDPELLPIGLLLKAHGKRVIYDAHEDLPRTFLFKPYLSRRIGSILMRLAEWFERFAARRLDGIVAATPVIGARFVSLAKNVAVVSNFPPLNDLPKNLVPWSERKNWIVYVGSMSQERGVADLVAATALLPKRLDVRVRLAGIFHSQQFRTELESMPGWENVDWLGYLNRSEIERLLLQSRVGVVVLHPEKAFMDSQPVKLYEYMAAGLPVIASDFPLWACAIDGCGLAIEPKRPKEIAAAIIRLLSDPAEAEAMGKRGRARVITVYNWSNEERRLLDLYNVVLNRFKHTDEAATMVERTQTTM